jgi:hypothetical protein
MLLLPILLLLTALAAAAAGYCMAMTQGFLFIGKAISWAGAATGLQDAATPPAVTNVILTFGFITLAGVAYAFYEFGTGAGFSSIGLTIVGVWVGTRFAPKSDSAFYVKMAYGSLVRRSADYEKANDQIRSAASRDLYERMEERFADVLGDKSGPAKR